MTIQLLKAWLTGKNYLYEVFLKNKKVVDFGCGEGEIVSLDPVNFTGVDVNTSAVSRLKEKGLHIVESSIENVPVPDASFDVVLCNNIIEHLTVDQAYNMLKEAQRILKPQGEIIIITPTPRTVWNTFGHVKPYTVGSIMKLFRKNSLESFESLLPMKKSYVLYYGTWAQNKVTFLVSTLFSNIFPSYAGSYLLILKKNENTSY